MRQCMHSILLGVIVLGAGCRPSTPDRGRSGPSTATQATATAIDLFNGEDLTGWTYELDDKNVKMEDVWSVKDGVLHCTGRPAGYLRTVKDDYENYVLTLEWRWPPGSKGGNNGVLVHTSTPGALGIWPKSIEVQLEAGHAGDFWIIGTELDVENEAERKHDRRHVNLTDGSEKPIGEWNQMEITCKGDEVIVKVNGDLVNHATNCSVTKGAISLQSEGAPIEYRNIRLRALPKVPEGGADATDRQPTNLAAWNFDATTAGQAPEGFTAGQNNPTKALASWTVAADPAAPSKPNVLLVRTENDNATYNLLLADKTSYRDVDLRVRIRPGTGTHDQGGGLIWRAKDANNYYICRINPLESNFRVYKVVAGKRAQLQSTDVETPTDAWYELGATMIGDHIQCFLDGTKLLDVTDGTFAEAGMIGLWTKADASSAFDDLVVGRAQG